MFRAADSQYPSHLTTLGRWKTWSLRVMVMRAVADLSLGVGQYMSSVFGREKETSSSEAFSELLWKRPCRCRMLDLCDWEATVREKSAA